MDQFVLGHRRVNCEIIDADEQGIPPDEHGFNAATSSLLDVIVETGNQVCRECKRPLLSPC